MHRLRLQLHNELHSRPSIYFEGPANVFHVALLDKGEFFSALLGRLGQLEKGPEATCAYQGILDLHGGMLKWERHTEFLTLTLVEPFKAPVSEWDVFSQHLQGLVKGFESKVISVTHVLVLNEEGEPAIPPFCGFKDPAGSIVGSGDARVWSDFRLSTLGVNRVLLVNRALNSYRLGRMIRRLLEIETYRMMACLALPVAKEVNGELEALESEWELLSNQNAHSDTATARRVLERTSLLSARVVRCEADSRQRFSAAQAYADIVFERISELREEHLGNCQRLGVFIERRFRPTVRYVAAIERRLERLSESVAHLGGLLQARIQAEVEEQNSVMLQSLEARASTQIKIQKAVEGLSAIAIAYYALSLLKMLHSALHEFGIADGKKAMLYLLPFVVVVLGLVVSHMAQARKA